MSSLAPELVVLAAAAAAMLVHLFARRNGPRLAGTVALAGLLAALAALAVTPRSSGPLFSGAFTLDALAVYFKAAVLSAAALAVLLAFRFYDVRRSETGETYDLILFAVIGMMAAVSTTDLIATYVAFELFAIPAYLLAGIFKRESRSGEAGIKFFFLGTLSSGIMLLGMALTFGQTGETSYAGIASFLPAVNERIALAGMILFFAGLFFKASLVPFHMWAPDVYEGAPTPISAFLSTASKAAVFGVLIRVATTVFPRFEVRWTAIFQLIAVATMTWGNIAALRQRSLKRLLGYSSIAHAGYLTIGLAAWGEAGSAAVLFYLGVYAVMNAAAFASALLVRRGDAFGEAVEDLRGLARRAPLPAAALLVILLGLTGIPPTAGFMGKYFLFSAAIGKKLYFLAVAGALNSVLSLFYYFRIGRAVFLEEVEAPAPLPPPRRPWAAGWAGLVLVLAAALVLLVGLAPSLLLKWSSWAGLGR